MEQTAKYNVQYPGVALITHTHSPKPPELQHINQRRPFRPDTLKPTC